MREAAVPSRLQQGLILLLAAALVAVGVAGGQWFMEADYVVFGYMVSPFFRRYFLEINCL